MSSAHFKVLFLFLADDMLWNKEGCQVNMTKNMNKPLKPPRREQSRLNLIQHYFKMGTDSVYHLWQNQLSIIEINH